MSWDSNVIYHGIGGWFVLSHDCETENFTPLSGTYGPYRTREIARRIRRQLKSGVEPSYEQVLL